MRRRSDRSIRRRGLAAALPMALALCIIGALPARAQDQQPQAPAQTPVSQTPTRPSTGDPKGAAPADTKQADAKPPAPKQSNSLPMPGTEDKSTYDPFHAQQDVDVGKFYLNKGDVDAAIARFEDAIRLRDNFAEPRLLLAECYEKKHQTAKALKYYREYLKVYPDAPDRKKVEKKIEKLSS